MTITQTMTAGQISEAIANAADGSVIDFEKGIYFLSEAIRVKGKKHLILDGHGSRLCPHFDRTVQCGETKAGPYHSNLNGDAEVMNLFGNDDLIIRGFTVDSDAPVNSTAYVLAVGEEYVDVRIDSRMPFRGNEKFVKGMTVSEKGEFTGIWWINTESDPQRRTLLSDEIPCTAPMRLAADTQLLGGQDFRVFPGKKSGLHVGERVAVLHSYYGLVAFTFRNCKNVVIEDVHISNFGGFGFTILPRCENFTFRRLNVCTDDKAHQPYATNSDGIHVTGLTGFLRIEDSYFNLLGDDSLNLHAQVLLITEVSGKTMKLVYPKICGRVSPDWAKVGDTLRLWNQHTLNRQDLTVTSVKPSKIENGDVITEVEVGFAEDVDIAVGDFISNGAYYPRLEIENCHFSNPRGRAVCLQSSDRIIIRNCKFTGVHNSAIYFSTAFAYWFESGPASNVLIENCMLQCSDTLKWEAGRTAIYARVNSEHPNVTGVHHNIVIRNNRIENCKGNVFRMEAVDGVSIYGNEFVDCPLPEPILVNCTGEIDIRI